MGLLCAAIVMINLTTIPFNTYDLNTQKRAIKTCKASNRCLKKFTKKFVDGKDIHYDVICGLPKKK